jgi:hypothetical protein
MLIAGVVVGGYGAGIGAVVGLVGDASTTSSREVWRAGAGSASSGPGRRPGAAVTFRW